MTGSLLSSRFAKGSLRAAFFIGALSSLLFVQVGAAVERVEPEVASGRTQKSVAVGRHFMAVTANPYATQAAHEVLKKGGNALDAALAAQWVLNLVEPQSSGIGGGAFLLYWNARERNLYAWDGRETAPSRANENFARDAEGNFLGYGALVASGKSVGVPGLVAMLAQAHGRHGKRAWASSFIPAIRLAQDGFIVSPRLHKLLDEETYLRNDASARALYYQPDGRAILTGERLRNPAFAETLLLLAREGATVFYRGKLADALIKEVAARGGLLAHDDLAGYQAQLRTAVCTNFRAYRVCGMPPPSSGGIALAQLLALMPSSGGNEGKFFDLGKVHRFTEAGRLVFADRGRYLADPAFVQIPLQELLAPAYLNQRAMLINPSRSMGSAAPGDIQSTPRFGEGEHREIPATTHLSIVDREGNAVAMTSSIEAGFGSRIMVGGFLLNNQLTDFSVAAEHDGQPVANRLEPGKRPLSSMSPTIVFDQRQRLWAVLGSPGGPRIINYVAQAVIDLIDHRAAADAVVGARHFGSRNGPTEIEAGAGAEPLVHALEALGHVVAIDEMTSGLHLVIRDTATGRWLGAADPRREGLALGR